MERCDICDTEDKEPNMIITEQGVVCAECYANKNMRLCESSKPIEQYLNMGRKDKLYHEGKKIAELCDFSKGIYVLNAVARSKDNDCLKASDQFSIREVIRSEQDIRRRYPRFRRQLEDFWDKESGEPINFYIYLSSNPRDPAKAFYNLAQRMISWSAQFNFNTENQENFKIFDDRIKKIDRQWYSELEKPESRAEKRFMWDVDFTALTKVFKVYQRIDEQVQERPILVPTPSGYHILSDTFNYPEEGLLDDYDDVSLKTDGSVFIGYIENREIIG